MEPIIVSCLPEAGQPRVVAAGLRDPVPVFEQQSNDPQDHDCKRAKYRTAPGRASMQHSYQLQLCVAPNLPLPLLLTGGLRREHRLHFVYIVVLWRAAWGWFRGSEVGLGKGEVGWLAAGGAMMLGGEVTGRATAPGLGPRALCATRVIIYDIICITVHGEERYGWKLRPIPHCIAPLPPSNIQTCRCLCMIGP
jgi:hypothetical protein